MKDYMTERMIQRDDYPVRVSSLIHFSPDVTKERIVAWVEKLKREGFVTSHTTKEWQGDGPCWYIP